MNKKKYIFNIHLQINVEIYKDNNLGDVDGCPSMKFQVIILAFFRQFIMPDNTLSPRNCN